MRTEYLKAAPYLTISRAAELKTELESKEEAHQSEWARARLENLEMREQVARRRRD